MNARLVFTAALILLAANSANAFGLFPHHSSRSSSSGSGSGSGSQTVMVSPAPEPETYLLMGVGLAAVVWIVRKRKK
jgi:PEP-CTERM motif